LNAVYVSAVAALAGSVVGALTTFWAAWVTQRQQADDDSVREGFNWILQNRNQPIEGSGVGEAFPVVDREPPDSVAPDIRMPEKSASRSCGDLPVVKTTGVDSIDTAGALRPGASGYFYDELRTTDNRITIPVIRLAYFIQNNPFNLSNRQPRSLGLFVADWMAQEGELQLSSQEGVARTAELIFSETW
jgi:hypothetical protein